MTDMPNYLERLHRRFRHAPEPEPRGTPWVIPGEEYEMEPRGTCGSWCNGCDECQPEQMTCPLCNKPVERDLSGTNPEVAYMDGWHHTACLDRYNAEPEQPYTDEQADELAASMRDTTSTRCLPDCQGDCPVCLPPEEYDKLHGKTTNTATLSSVLHYEAGQADERARIVQVIEGRKRPHPCVWNEWMDELLAAIRQEGDDA